MTFADITEYDTRLITAFQKPATNPILELDEYSLHHILHLFKFHFNSILLFTSSLLSNLFSSGSLTTILHACLNLAMIFYIFARV